MYCCVKKDITCLKFTHFFISINTYVSFQVQAVGIVSLICKNLQQLMKKETDTDVSIILSTFVLQKKCN